MRNDLIRLAKKLVDVPYIWGGQTVKGFDCSGFVVWVLQVFGLFPEGSDTTAAGLAKKFKKTTNPLPGDLVFYGTPSKVIHVMIYAGNGFVIGASGGNSTTTTLEKALAQNAKVKVKAERYRTDLLFYASIQ